MSQNHIQKKKSTKVKTDTNQKQIQTLQDQIQKKVGPTLIKFR